jgi:mono/diheme cytochrome c family protein
MKGKAAFVGLLMLGFLFAGAAARQPEGSGVEPPAKSGSSVQVFKRDDDLRLEGEKRFRANCGRCHQSPHKFNPRMMLTIERHMRVRALVTDEDMRLIVRYLSQ